MDESEAASELATACADGARRLHELAEALRREREERAVLEQAGQETRRLVHALNDALSVVGTFAAALSEEVEPGHPMRESVEEISGAAKRAAALMRALGDLHLRAGKGEHSGHGRA